MPLALAGCQFWSGTCPTASGPLHMLFPLLEFQSYCLFQSYCYFSFRKPFWVSLTIRVNTLSWDPCKLSFVKSCLLWLALDGLLV